MTSENIVQKITRWRSDFQAFAEEALWITTKDGTFEPFRFNKAQQKLWSEIKKKLDAGEPVRIYILKARQLGFSTFAQGLAFWATSLHKYTNALVVSHDIQSAEALFLKSRVFWQSMPSDARPERKLSNRRELYFAIDDPKNPARIGNQSRVLVQTAADKHLGASLTLRFVHLSEFARYEEVSDNVDLALATLKQAVPDKPGTIMLLETTAFGMGVGYRVWKSKAYDQFFISWVAGEEYTSPGEPLPRAEWYDHPDAPWGDEVTVAGHVESELKYWWADEATDPAWLENEVGCRMRWRRRKITDDLLGRVDLWNQEYPITPDEAFLTSGDAVFDNAKLSDLKDACKEAKHYRYSVSDRTLTPTRLGDIRVFEKPIPQMRYIMGVDVAEGLRDGDASAVQILKLEADKLTQVLVYEGKIAPDDLADLAVKLGRWYNSAYAAVEINGPGYATVLRMHKKLHYNQMYARETFDNKSRKLSKKIGWHTNVKTKQIMVSNLRQEVDTDHIRFNDAGTLEQMQYYVINNDKYEAAQGYNDDLVMSLALAVQMASQQVPSRATQDPTAPPKYSFHWWAQQADTEGADEDQPMHNYQPTGW